MSASGPVDGEWREVHGTVCRHFENAVDHGVHRIAARGQEVDGGAQQGFGPGAAGGGKDDKPGVDVAGVDEGSKVSGVLGHEDEVVLDATSQDSMVGGAEAAEVAWMLGEMHALGVEVRGDTRGQALVEKQAHRSGV